MNEQMLAALRGLPRDRLEDLVIRAMTELRIGRAERASNSYFYAVLSGIIVGSAISASGFLIGAALR